MSRVFAREAAQKLGQEGVRWVAGSVDPGSAELGALQLAVQGEATTGPLQHAIEAGLLLTRHRGRFQDQVFDIAGTGHIDGSLQTLPSAGFGDANMNRDERSTELFLRCLLYTSRCV